MTDLPYRSVRDGRHRSLVSSDQEEAFQFDWFAPDYWGDVCRPVSGGGRGSAWFLSPSRRQSDYGEQWVLRHYRRGGLPGKLAKRTYLFLGERSVRSFNEFKLLHALYSQGLPVPRPVAAGYERSGLGYRAAIIVDRIVGTHSLLSLNQPEHRPLWEAAGRCIRRFHNAGVYHADLNATNILVRPESEEVFLIDFDRGEQRPDSPADAGWKAANLARLERGLYKHWPENHPEPIDAFWEAFHNGYG